MRMNFPKINRRCLCSRRMKIVYAVVFGVPLLTVVVLFGVCLGYALDSKKPSWLADLGDLNGADFLPADEESKNGRLERFRSALKLRTVSTGDESKSPAGEMALLIEQIKKGFPRIHNSSNVVCKELGAPGEPYSLLYRVSASDEFSKNSPSQMPYLLMAHLDVVPVEEKYWNYDPFGAEVVDGFVYARGAIDDKNNAFSILEALEHKLGTGKPIKRTFYIAFGHDEETGGSRGQKFIAEFLRKQWNVTEFAFVLDEGLFIIDSLIPGVPGPVALIGVTEKGSANVDLSITGMDAGHSSNPPSESTIDILAEAITNVRSNPQPRSFSPGAPEYVLLETLAPYADFMFKMVYSNLWLFSGVIAGQFEAKRVTNAAIRTTTAFTMIEGGIKVNVMPASAKATINHRVHYSQTVDAVVEHDREAVNDGRVQVVLQNGSYPAHPVSPFGPDAPYYKLIAKSVLQIYPGIPVGPGTLIANTDTRWYLNFTKNIYRFSAVRMDEADTSRFHGHDERISVESYFNVNNFYYRLMQNAEEDVRKTTSGSLRKEGEL